MKTIVLLLMILYARIGHGQTTCKDTSHPRCDCYLIQNKEYEYQCPPRTYETDGIVVHVQKGIVSVDCYGPTFDVDLVPTINSTSIHRLDVRFCQLPTHGFREIVEKLSGVDQIQSLKHGSANMTGEVVTKQYYEGLKNLRSLELVSGDLIHLDEDVFENTPSLTSIDLMNNKIELKPNLFKHTPLLVSLVIAVNGLEGFPEGIFSNLRNLERLDLWGNKLDSLNETSFHGLVSLKSLELSSNKIYHLVPDVFAQLGKLTKISLRTNHIRNVPKDLFKYNQNLELVRMGNNPIQELPDYLFANLTHLTDLELYNCKLQSLPEHIFEGAKKLTVIKLRQNRLTELSPNLFKGLNNLKEISLDGNELVSLGSSLQPLKRLQILHLQNNRITVIDERAFRDLTALKELDLSGNGIREIHLTAFQSNERLSEINLAHNKYTFDSNSSLIVSPFNSCTQLKILDLSFNSVTKVYSELTENKVNLERLDLSHNYIESISAVFLQTVAPHQVEIDLSYNNISTIDFEMAEVLARQLDILNRSNNNIGSSVRLSNNPIKCDCRIIEVVRYFRNELDPRARVLFDLHTDNLTCAEPPDYRDFPVERIPPSKLLCPLDEVVRDYDGCPAECACSWRPFDTTVLVDCSQRNLSAIPEFYLPSTFGLTGVRFNQTEVHLEANSLTSGPTSNLTDFDNVTRLYLSNNQIKHVDWVPPYIEVLTIDNNEIEHIEYPVLERLNSSQFLSLALHANPWRCDCRAENLTNFLRQQIRKVDTSSVFCSGSSNSLVDRTRADLCHDWKHIYTVVIVMTLLLIIAASAALYYRYQQELKVWLFAKNLCLWWVTEEELDKDKLFDAFISYSNKDEEFVMQNLIPVLEGGPHPYKLCWHKRNWVPGEFITKQIVSSVHDSRRTLVVLSKNFLESVWGIMEFRTAHMQAMKDGRVRVIVVVLGDVEMDKLDNEMKTYLKTNTYVSWGDDHFWNKLRYALPHSNKSLVRNNQKHANLMTKIDDKFNLVAPSVTPNAETTPPVLTLDAGLLKKHPLNLIPRTHANTPPADAEAGLLE